jgi:hypothetical protein
VSLINASNDAEIGSKTLERPREEIFALQDDLAKEVAIFLRQQLGEEVTLKEIRQGTTNQKAWELLEQAEEVSRNSTPCSTLAIPLQPAGAYFRPIRC